MGRSTLNDGSQPMVAEYMSQSGDAAKKDSYASKLKGSSHPLQWESSEEEGEVTEEDYASDDDWFEEMSEGPCIRLSKEDKRRIRKAWRRTLFVKLLGRSISYTYLVNRVKQLWALTGNFQAVDLENGFFCFRFEKKEDYDHVLLGGSLVHWWPLFNCSAVDSQL